MARNMQVSRIDFINCPEGMGFTFQDVEDFWYTAHTSRKRIWGFHIVKYPPWSPSFFPHEWCIITYVLHIARLISIFHVNISPKFPFLHHSWQWVQIHIRSLVQDGCRYMIYLLLVSIFCNSAFLRAPNPPATVVNILGGNSQLSAAFVGGVASRFQSFSYSTCRETRISSRGFLKGDVLRKRENHMLFWDGIHIIWPENAWENLKTIDLGPNWRLKSSKVLQGLQHPYGGSRMDSKLF